MRPTMTMTDFNQRPATTYREAELRCEMVYQELGSCWHIFTPEKFPVIFGAKEDFKFGMNLVAVCARAFPDVRILTFEIMTNHLHLTVAGSETRVKQFFEMLCYYLRLYLKRESRPLDLSGWNRPPRLISDLNDLRNVIAYNNRNGYLVNPGETPFTYPWGANRFFFNPELRMFHERSDDRLSVRRLREMFHTRSLDRYNGLKVVDGYVTPVCYCDIEVAERLFRDAHHYFYKVSRDVEGQKNLAAEIGEGVFYTDEELFAIISAKCREGYKVGSPSSLPRDAKIHLAKILHYDYNAGNGRIARLLRLDNAVVEALFPSGKQ